MTKNAITKTKAGSVKEMIQSDRFKSAIAQALPKHLTPDRFARIAIVAMTRTPALAECTQASLFDCLMDLSQLGLEPDGRRAHLIPYGDKATLIIDYKGLVELAMRSGNVANIHADLVCENDRFEYDRGSITQHKIDFRKDRGEPFAVYAICRFKDNTEKTEVMTLAEVESIRNRSKAGRKGPWVTDWGEMAKKTVFRRLSKWLPLSPEYRDALEADADVPPDLAHGITVSPPKPIRKAPAAEAEQEHGCFVVGTAPEPENSEESVTRQLANFETEYPRVFAETSKGMSIDPARWRDLDLIQQSELLAALIDAE